MAQRKTPNLVGIVSTIVNGGTIPVQITFTQDGTTNSIAALATYANVSVGDRVLVLAAGRLYYAIGRA